MRTLVRRAVPVYLGLLLLLSAAGLVNQHLYHRQTKLIAERQKLMGEVANLRVQAAAVDGPLAVARWAGQHGMVPAPEAGNVGAVAPGPAPVPKLPPTGLEVRTIWR